MFHRVMLGYTRTYLPICSLLSGGLDSSAITAMSSHVLAKQNRNLISFSAVLPSDYSGKEEDESYYINLMQQTNLTKQMISASQQGPFDTLSDLIDYPTETSRRYLYYAFNSAARKSGAKFILDGCFGEMSGISYWADEYLGELLRKCKLKQLIYNVNQHRRLFNRSLHSILLRDILMPNLPPSIQTKLRLRPDTRHTLSSSLIRPEFISQHLNSQQLESKLIEFKYSGTKLGIDSRANLFKIYSNAYANTGASFSVQEHKAPRINYRYPYTDPRLIEFCLSVPNELRYKNGYRRYLVRRGMDGLMNKELLYRTTKAPFSVDYHIRYNKQLPLLKQIFDTLKHNHLVREVLDINRMEEYIKLKMNSNLCYTKNNYIGMQIIPHAIYLAAFLTNNSS